MHGRFLPTNGDNICPAVTNRNTEQSAPPPSSARWNVWFSATTVLSHRPAPSELRSVERMILHYDGSPYHPAPSELCSVERMILHYRHED